MVLILCQNLPGACVVVGPSVDGITEGGTSINIKCQSLPLSNVETGVDVPDERNVGFEEPIH